VTCLVGAQQRTTEPKRFALHIGVSHYDDKSIPSLNFPAADVMNLEGAFSGSGLRYTRVIRLDDARLPPTKSEILRAFQEIQLLMNPDDTFVLYFSGHGFNLDGKSYLAMRDAGRRILDRGDGGFCGAVPHVCRGS